MSLLNCRYHPRLMVSSGYFGFFQTGKTTECQTCLLSSMSFLCNRSKINCVETLKYRYLYLKCRYLGDNYIQNIHLWRYIVSYTVKNFVLRRRISRMVIPILMHFLTFICQRHSICTKCKLCQ